MNLSYATRPIARREKSLRNAHLGVAAMVLLLLAGATASAQVGRPPLRASGAAGPMTGVRPNVWSAASTYVVNTTDADADVLAVLGFDLDPNIQFGRQLWIPAHSMLRAWIPFHGPKFKPVPHTILKVQTLLLDQNATGTEHAYTRDQGFMIGQRDQYDHIVDVLSRQDDTATMVFSARRSLDSNSRQPRQNNATVIEVSPQRLSPCPQTFGEFDSLVLGDGLDQLDKVQMENIRQWVATGKTLWIIAGEVNDEQLQALLGDAWTACTIDRTELQDFTVVGRHSPVTVHTDDPVELVRMVPGKNMTVLDRVNGYPAAMEFPLGAGRVFITTLGPAGWTTSPTKTPAALSHLSSEIFAPEMYQPTLPAKLADHLAALSPAQVGNKIVPRSMVMIVLGGFVGVFLLSGIFLLRTGKMEWFAAAGVGLAVVASAALLVEAKAVNESVPLTVASATVTQVFPQLQSASAHSHLVVYNPGPQGAGPVESQTGGLFWPTTGVPLGSQPRLVFTDRDQWQWRNLSVTPGTLGMLRGEFAASADLPQPIRAVVHLSSTAADATVETGPLGSLGDVLLAGPNGAMLARPAAGDSLAVSEADLIRNDQYTTGSLLTDTQRQHQETYRTLFTDVSPINEPVLLGFASKSIATVNLPRDVQRRETNLVSIPIEFAAPAVGSTVTIPSAFIPFDVTRIAGISVGMFPYSTTLHGWIPNLSGPLRTQQLLQFTLPRALLPMKLTAVTFDLTIRAPGRDVTLFKLNGKVPSTLVSAHGPVGMVEAKMTGDDCPAVDNAGNLLFGFTVTPDNDPKHTWEISDARIIVTGEKLARTADDAPAIRVAEPPTHPTAEAVHE